MRFCLYLRHCQSRAYHSLMATNVECYRCHFDHGLQVSKEQLASISAIERKHLVQCKQSFHCTQSMQFKVCNVQIQSVTWGRARLSPRPPHQLRSGPDVMQISHSVYRCHCDLTPEFHPFCPPATVVKWRRVYFPSAIFCWRCELTSGILL